MEQRKRTSTGDSRLGNKMQVEGWVEKLWWLQGCGKRCVDWWGSQVIRKGGKVWGHEEKGKKGKEGCRSESAHHGEMGNILKEMGDILYYRKSLSKWVTNGFNEYENDHESYQYQPPIKIPYEGISFGSMVPSLQSSSNLENHCQGAPKLLEAHGIPTPY